MEGVRRERRNSAEACKDGYPACDAGEEWRRVLEALAMAFYSGDARVEPKSYPTTCRHCAQRVLCRLDVSQLEVDEDEDETATAEVSRG